MEELHVECIQDHDGEEKGLEEGPMRKQSLKCGQVSHVKIHKVS